jgi:hypothetical protein
MDLDVRTLYLCLATILAVAIIGSLPAFIRVIRMRRFERMLGSLHWPFVLGVDNRERLHKEPPRNG